MARLPRLVLPGHAHYVIQRAHGALEGRGVFADAADRDIYLSALREAARAEKVLIHAYAMLASEVHLLVTPAVAAALGRMVQALARRYSAAYNRRHGHRGSLWDGRFRCAVLEPGAVRAAALQRIDGLSAEAGVTSAPTRTGGERQPGLTDPPEYWGLGNTPFEREAAYAALLQSGVEPALSVDLQAAALGGWAVGSPGFKADVAMVTHRPVEPRPRGRPRKTASS